MQNKDAYKNAVAEIAEIKEKHPDLTRANRFQILEQFYGIPEEETRMIDRYQRAIRAVFPKDKVGEQLEQEWHTPQHIRTGEQEWTELFKQNALNI